MTPFAQCFQTLRRRHKIRQTDLAKLLGYTASHVSAVALGVRAPTQEFIERIHAALRLSEAELEEMQRAAIASRRWRLLIEPDAPAEVYWLLEQLRQNAGRLQPEQIKLMECVIQMKMPAQTARRASPGSPNHAGPVAGADACTRSTPTSLA